MSISSIEEGKNAELTLSAISKKDINNLAVKIDLPENLEIVEGDLQLNLDLEKDKSQEINLIIKSVKEEGKGIISASTAGGGASTSLGVSVDSEGRITAEPQQRVPDEDITEYYETKEEWEEETRKDMEENPEKYYRACFDADGCRIPDPLKGEELNDYFKSLNLTDDPVYVMVQFDVIGADPSWLQVNLLKLQGMTVFEDSSGAGAHTYYAKASKNFLENKNYDFIRWIGIREADAKIPGSLREKIEEGCSGSVDILIIHYENFEANEVDLIKGGSEHVYGIGDNTIRSQVSIKSLTDIASFNFIEKIEISVLPSICPPGAINCGSNPFENLVCENKPTFLP